MTEKRIGCACDTAAVPIHRPSSGRNSITATTLSPAPTRTDKSSSQVTFQISRPGGAPRAERTASSCARAVTAPAAKAYPQPYMTASE